MAALKLRDRAFALSLAILFLFTAVATSAAVVISIVSSNKAAKKAASANTSSTTNNNNSNKLAGTKLTGFTPIPSIPKLETIDTKLGSGATATSKSTVSVLYTGAVASTGIVFQSSLDNGPSPVTFPLSNVIAGWQQGIPGMKVGGERRILIPAALAYGANPPSGSGIPANADLVFDVTLLNVK
jgi:FKBP-type peptidyl-prolyl cis-trans isomerase